MKRKIYLAVLFVTIFAAIVCMATGCKKESIAEPATTTALPVNKLFVVDLQSSEPTGPFFGYTLSLNGTAITSPATVTAGDSVYVEVYDPLGHAYILQCNLDNANVYPNGNYQYAGVTWSYIIPQ